MEISKLCGILITILCVKTSQKQVDAVLTEPEFINYSPSYGPIDGNTVITIVSNVNLNMVLAAELRNIQFDSGTGARGIYNDVVFKCRVVRYGQIGGNNFKIITPSVSKKLIGLTLEIYINVNSSKTQNGGIFNTGFRYVYKESPVITSVTPQSVFLGGGLPITAIGRNLDSVANPLMLVYMESRAYNYQDNSYYVMGTTTFESEDTRIINSNMIIAISPVINTTAGYNNPNNPNQVPQRRKRQASTDNSNFTINDEEREFFIGFRLDGAQTFLNLSQAIDPMAGRMLVFGNPEVHQFEQVKEFDPDVESGIEIKGKRLNKGPTLRDYTVTIGDATCKLLDLTQNSMVCQPPNKEPNVVHKVRSMEGKPAVKVTVGFLKFNVGHVNYKQKTSIIPIIIGVAVGVAVLIIIISIVIAVLCCRKSGTKT